jgi:hypothetical protein
VDVQIGEIYGWAFGSNGEDIRHALTVREAAVFSTENIRDCAAFVTRPRKHARLVMMKSQILVEVIAEIWTERTRSAKLR